MPFLFLIMVLILLIALLRGDRRHAYRHHSSARFTGDIWGWWGSTDGSDYHGHHHDHSHGHDDSSWYDGGDDGGGSDSGCGDFGGGDGGGGGGE